MMRDFSLVALAIAIWLHVVCACNNQSLEFCSTSADCASANPNNQNCVRLEDQSFFECRSGNQTDCRCVEAAFSFQQCTGNNDDCSVIPSITACERDADCRQLELCAKSKENGIQWCIGCLRYADDAQDYTLVEPGSKRCDQPRPPCGQLFDLCSDSLSCDGSLECVTFNAKGEPRPCPGDTRCQCLPLTLTSAPCEAGGKCNNPREVCVRNNFQNQNTCVSCDAARHEPSLILLNESDCKDVPPLPLPEYNPSRNGLSYDLCANDAVCLGDRTCVQFKDSTDPSLGIRSCKQGPDSFCFCKGEALKCKFSSDCPTGELCATIPRFEVVKSCISAALIPNVPVDSREVFGFREVPQGSNLTFDQCNFDWNCAGNRRCTHASDDYGGCAGRRGCSCVPLVSPICASDSDCVDGEVCVKMADGKSDPLCVSKISAAEDDLYEAPDFEPPAATPVPGDGLSRDPCREDGDCAGDLGCYHAGEFGEPCDGRYNCFCYRVSDAVELVTTCKTSKDCVKGEICAVVVDSIPRSPRCYGRYAFDQSSLLQVVGPVPSPRPSPLLSSSPSLSASPSQSVSVSVSMSEPDSSSGAGAIATIESSPEMDFNVDEDGDIQDEDSDIQPDDDDTATDDSDTPDVAASSNAPEASAAEPTSETVCIDESLLRHLPSHDLVFASARRGAVLCDGYGSCATPGHLVTWKGRGMSMRTYCKMYAKCTKRVAWVNSPRMRRGLRIVSPTKGLKFTALAARYETWVEEKFLVRLLQLGA